MKSIKNEIDGATILLTGGTGSFGGAFTDHIIQKYNPAKLVIFSRDEHKQFEMKQRTDALGIRFMRYFLGDVRDSERLSMALKGVDIVVHAAALKHVPAAEYNPYECVKTNIQGAENISRVASFHEVKKVLALSTDKAAEPLNLYGATKLVSDKLFVASNNMFGVDGTKYSVVRYGNVLGSRGSVVPYFKKLLADGKKKLPITDERMTRFWITLEQGVDFVMNSLHRMRGGEIFIPKIPSSTVADLTRAIDPEAEHEIVGIRPGEKLHETMIPKDDSRQTVELDDHFVIQPQFEWWDKETYSLETQAKPVKEGFVYSSEENPEALGPDELRNYLKGLGIL